MQIMKFCVENEVSIYSTKEGYTFDDNINSKVLSFAFGLAAEIKHKLISLRTREAMALRKLEGKHMGRKKGSDVKMQHLAANKEYIMTLIISNEKIGTICDYLGVSYDTFYRFRNAHPDIFMAMKQRTEKR